MHPNTQNMPANAGAAALRTFFNIMEKWGLDNDQAQVLLAIPRTTFFNWRKNPDTARVTHDTLERLSYLLGIFKSLRLVYSENCLADSWLTRQNDNPLFGGKPPLERMLGGQVADLYITRQLLDARRGVV